MAVSTNEGRDLNISFLQTLGLWSWKILCRKRKLDGLTPVTCGWLLVFSESYLNNIIKLTNVKSSPN